jgi:autotransporter-associated beta strand protein
MVWHRMCQSLNESPLNPATATQNVIRSRNWTIAMVAVSATLLGACTPSLAQPLRVLGVDISYWNCGTSATGISQANWNTAFTTGNRVFVQIRATRGGTTGLGQTSGTPGGGTNETLSCRYDDSRFLQNITRATVAGMISGPYHFARPDVAGNTGTDEADHHIEMAGVFMRPGYMMPMYDMEATSGDNNRLRQFAIDFSARIYAVMQIRPCVYINGNYSGLIDSGATTAQKNALAQPAALTPSVVSPAYPMLWDARYSDNTATWVDIPVQTGSPKTTYTSISAYYGPWDDYGNTEPWSFWQYASVASIPGFNNVDTGIDVDVSHGDIEYVRNYLVPAVWWNNSSGDWSTLTNWNSGQPAPTPVTPVDQATPYAYTASAMPTARLPGAAGSGPTSGQYDTVILERPSANITVTLSTGTHNIRKLYMREALNITGGSLTINYNPTYRADDSTTVLHAGPISAQFSGPVTLSNSASLSVHTLQVDATRTFTLGGGTLTFNTIKLMPTNTTPAKIAMVGDVSFNGLTNGTATIAKGTGTGTSGSIDLGGGNRSWNVANGSATVDLSVDVPVSNGALSKTGLGTMRLGVANTYGGGTTINAGTLEGAVASSIPGNVTNSAGTLKLDTASTLASGGILALAAAPAAGAVNLSFSGTQTVNSLYFGTTRKAAGTWAAAGATHNNAAFTGAGILNVTGGPASTTAVSLTSGSNPSAYGDSLTFAATVTGNSPSGTVQFKVDGIAFGSPVALVGGSASLDISNLAVSGSPHQITAYYSGDDNNNLSDNSASLFSQTITARSTSCLLASSVNPSASETNVTFTATVDGVPPAAELPTGDVVFSANSEPFATNALASGIISASTASLPPGTNAMTAQYVGNGNFLGSLGSVDQVVVKPVVTCSLTNALLSIADHLDGTFTMTFLGTPQADYFVMASPDATAPMTNWAPVVGSTNTVTNVSGLWQFTATNTTPQQFYRSTAVAPCP